MSSLSVCAIERDDLPEIARFLASVLAEMGPTSCAVSEASDGGEYGPLLATRRWRLLRNPMRPEGLEFGHCLRRDDGTLAGTHLIHAWRFRMGTRTLAGLGSGGMFVDPGARVYGFVLFKRFLGLPGADFKFANTCNRNASRLWAKMGGKAVPRSENEDLLPLRVGPLAREVALRWGGDDRLASALGTVASAGNTWLALRRPRSTLHTRESRDWERLATLARRQAAADNLVSDRTPEVLRWAYAEAPEHEGRRIFEFVDADGRDGWFALGRQTRGLRRQIRGTALLDWCLPPPPFDPGRALAAAVSIAAEDSDLFFVRGRRDVRVEESGLGFRRRTFESPSGYVHYGGSGPIALESRLVQAQADFI